MSDLLWVVTTNTQFYIYLPLSSPTPSIVWKRIGAPMDNKRMSIGKTGHELIITGLTYADQGQYQCVGENSASEKEKKNDFTLRVEGKYIRFNVFFDMFELLWIVS